MEKVTSVRYATPEEIRSLNTARVTSYQTASTFSEKANLRGKEKPQEPKPSRKKSPRKKA